MDVQGHRLLTPEEEQLRRQRREQFWTAVWGWVLVMVIGLAMVILFYLFLSWEPILTRTLLGWFNISAMISALAITALVFMYFMKGSK